MAEMSAPVSRPNFKDAAYLDGVPLATQADLQNVIRSFNDSLQAKILELLFNGATLPSGTTVDNATTTVNMSNHITSTRRRFGATMKTLLAGAYPFASDVMGTNIADWKFPDGVTAPDKLIVSELLCTEKYRFKTGWVEDSVNASPGFMEIKPRLVFNASKNGLVNCLVDIKVWNRKLQHVETDISQLFLKSEINAVATELGTLGVDTGWGTSTEAVPVAFFEGLIENWLAGKDITPTRTPDFTASYSTYANALAMADLYAWFADTVNGVGIAFPTVEVPTGGVTGEGTPITVTRPIFEPLKGAMFRFLNRPINFEWYAVAAK